MNLVIDAHHHFWDPEQGDYPWMQGPAMSAIRRRFGPADLAPALDQAKVDKTIIVQTWSSLEETEDFLQIAGATDFVAGVVGWVDLTDPDLGETLARLQSGENGRYLVGVRHQVHDEPDPDWLLRADVQRGLRAVAEAGLVYDLLTRPRELPAALTIAERFPQLRLVIDHISKPDIAGGEIDQWRRLLQRFGPLSHVSCKVSGMVTEADWQHWTPADLKPYIESVLEIFGPERLLFGSDWPVSLSAAPYTRVKQALEENLTDLDPPARAAIMGGNAIAVYRLAV